MDVAPRGVKRKRNASDDVYSTIRRKLHHELKEVHKATKKAKSFEVRKMIKRLKFPRSRGTDTSEDLKTQLLVLKHLDVEIVGNTAFKTKISKRKQLYSNEHVKVALEEEIGSDILALAQPGTPAYRAQSKLLSSKNLAERVTSAVQAMQLKVSPQDREQMTRPTEGQEGQLGVAHSESEPEGDDESASGAGTEDENDNIGDVDEEWESGTVEETGAASSTDEEDTHGNEKNVATKLSRAHSTFLPSLAVGFVPGDSDDPDLEAEAKIAEVDKQKNRRGQRARRAIWEKKYGRNANHKKKELEQQKLRKQQVKKHKDSKRQNNQHEHVMRRDTNADTKRGQKPAEPPTSRANERPLHPSWEAKKRLKEQSVSHIVPSQGKRIVF
ncbi:BUD22 domain containing protein [Amanita muscaria]